MKVRYIIFVDPFVPRDDDYTDKTPLKIPVITEQHHGSQVHLGSGRWRPVSWGRVKHCGSSICGRAISILSAIVINVWAGSLMGAMKIQDYICRFPHCFMKHCLFDPGRRGSMIDLCYQGSIKASICLGWVSKHDKLAVVCSISKQTFNI